MDNVFSSVTLCKKLEGFGQIETTIPQPSKKVSKELTTTSSGITVTVERYKRGIFYLQC